MLRVVMLSFDNLRVEILNVNVLGVIMPRVVRQTAVMCRMSWRQNDKKLKSVLLFYVASVPRLVRAELAPAPDVIKLFWGIYPLPKIS